MQGGRVGRVGAMGTQVTRERCSGGGLGRPDDSLKGEDVTTTYRYKFKVTLKGKAAPAKWTLTV